MAKDMKEYYMFRQELRKLYSNDVSMQGDLCGRILQIRDKYKSVNSINVSIQDYNINIDIEPGTSENKQNEIIQKVTSKIKDFIQDNKSSISDKSINVDEYLNSENNMFCDTHVVGNSVNINL